MRYVFYAKLKQDDDGRWLVRFRDVPEALTDGRDRKKAVSEAADALGAALSGYVAEQKNMPTPSSAKRGEVPIAVPSLVAAKLALHQAMQEQAITNVALASRLGVTEAIVRRLINPDHSSKIEKVEVALEALGKRLIIEAA